MCFHIKETCRKPVNEERSSSKHIAPKMKRDRCMCKKSYASFNYVTVFTFSNAILLVSMWTCYTVCNTMFLKERTKIRILTPQVGLNMNNFFLEKTLYMTLELQKDIKHIRFAFK
jgi:hypothetical protein